MMRIKWAVPVVALGLLAAACGDDGGTTKAASTTTASTTGASASGASASGASGSTTTVAAKPVLAPGIKNNKITVGGVNQETAFGGAGDGAKARFDRFNKEGGINGLTIDFLGSRDDGGDADRNSSLVKELVEKDGVYAIVPSTPTYMQPATGDYLKSKSIPYFTYGYAPVACNNDYGFAWNGCTVPGVAKELSTGNLAPLITAAGKTSGTGLNIAIAGRAESGGQLFTDAFVKVATKLGMNVVYAESKVPGGGTADMTPFADAIMAKKPDIVDLVTDFPSALALKAKLVASGYKGIIADNAAYVPGLLDSSPAAAAALEATYVVTTYPTLLETSDFAKQMQADFTASNITKIQSGTLIGYVEADLFVEMLKLVNPNFDKFATTINAGTKTTPKTGGVPTEWPKFHSSGATCNSAVKIESKAYKLAVPLKCYDSFVP